MKAFLGGTRAVEVLTCREVLRQRLWLLPLLAVLVILVILPGLDAVDADDRLKLAVVSVGSVIGFVLTLAAVLVVAAMVRRDLESRTGFVLFAKPLPRAAYLLGRFLGLLLVLAIALLLMGGMGCAAIAWQLGGLPAPRAVQAPSTCWLIEKGQAIEQPADAELLRLRGSPRHGEGQGLRCRFDGVSEDRDLSLLLRLRVGGSSLLGGVERARVQLSALLDDGRALRLAVDPESPYGQRPGDVHELLLRDRDARRRDLHQDYARVLVPAEAVQDGSVTIQLDRLEAQTWLGIDPDSSLLLAGGASSFTASALAAGAVLLAQAAVLGAAGLLLVLLAKLPVALLGGLTIFFGGHALGALRMGLPQREGPTPLSRFLDLYGIVQPDFGRYPVEAQLAAGEVVHGGTVLAAWGYYGSYALVFLVLAWLVLRRSEL